MKTKLALKVVGLIGLLALISAGYCFWLMTVPLSYDWVPVVLIGFVLSTGVFVTYPKGYGVLHRAYYGGDEPAFRAWAVSALGDLLILDKWKQAAWRNAGT